MSIITEKTVSKSQTSVDFLFQEKSSQIMK